MAEETSLTTRMAAWPAETKNYFEELHLEMKRVTWPPWKQVRATTAVVDVLRPSASRRARCSSNSLDWFGWFLLLLFVFTAVVLAMFALSSYSPALSSARTNRPSPTAPCSMLEIITAVLL